MEKVLFTPENHSYIRESDGCPLLSVSGFYKTFSVFDTETSLRRKAAQKVFGPTKYEKFKKEWNAQGGHIYDPAYVVWLETIIPDKDKFYEWIENYRQEWASASKAGTDKGSEQHSIFEEEDIKRGYVIQESTGQVFDLKAHGKTPDGRNTNTVSSLLDLEDGFYGELMLWLFLPRKIVLNGKEYCGIAGQIDRAFKFGKTIAFEDYKTNKKFSDFAINVPNFGKQTHLPPFQDMYKTDISDYKIQLSTYGYIAESHGLEVVDLRLLHVKDEVVDKVVEVPYLGELVGLGLSNLLNSAA